MAKTDLLKEAIADAKAVRETALANAKIALEEAFTPRIQSMLSAKLSEEEGMEDEPVAEIDEVPAPEGGEDVVTSEDMEGEEMDETAEEPTETNGNGMDAAAGAPVDEDMEGEEVSEEEDMEEDLELEAILRELEEDPMEEVSDSSDIGKGDNKVDMASGDDTDDPGEGELTETEEEKMDEDDDKDVTMDEIIKALREDEGEDKVEEDYEDKKVDETEEKELEEAYNVIRFLKSKINEVNLLNAKLLFSNKLFRNHSLNEGQKMKVIENFDRAQSLREVKLVFATLSESFNINGKKTKRTIKESYASKASRSTKPKKQVISEGNDLAARWKKLANL